MVTVVWVGDEGHGGCERNGEKQVKDTKQHICRMSSFASNKKHEN